MQSPTPKLILRRKQSGETVLFGFLKATRPGHTSYIQYLVGLGQVDSGWCRWQALQADLLSSNLSSNGSHCCVTGLRARTKSLRLGDLKAEMYALQYQRLEVQDQGVCRDSLPRGISLWHGDDCLLLCHHVVLPLCESVS